MATDLTVALQLLLNGEILIFLNHAQLIQLTDHNWSELPLQRNAD